MKNIYTAIFMALCIAQEDVDNYTGLQYIRVEAGNDNTSQTAYFDDLRFFPSDASMITYTYNLSGNLTSVCDENDLYAYYEYDDLGRTTFNRDDDRNIVSHERYHLGNPADFIFYDDTPDGLFYEDQQITFIPNEKTGNYELDLGDNTTPVSGSDGASFTHTYSYSGTYTVTFSLIINGESFSKIRTITIYENQ